MKTGLVRNVLVAKSQAQVAAAAALAAAYYGPNSPYGHVIPDENKVKGYTLEQVRQFYQNNFGAVRARIYIAGQFDTAAVKTAIEQAFGSWGRRPAVRGRFPPNPSLARRSSSLIAPAHLSRRSASPSLRPRMAAPRTFRSR